MSDQFTFQFKTDRQALEEMSDSDVLLFFQTEGADALMQLYRLSQAALHPNPEMVPKADCHGTVSYNTTTGKWEVSVGCKSDK